MPALWETEIAALVNSYADERYEELIALDHRIQLHANDPETWADLRREIMAHLKRYPLRVRRAAWRREITEWREHFCTLWDMRRQLEANRLCAS